MFLRKILTAFTTAGLLVLSGCGDDDENGFCRDYRQTNEAFDTGDTSDPDVLRDALAELSPPEEIAADWELLGERWEEFSGVDDVEDVDVDPMDLQAAEDFVQRSDEYNQALRNVRSYLRHECNVDLD